MVILDSDAVRSGAVHALRCRRRGPRPLLRFQSPLNKQGMQFSSTRLSEVIHLTVSALPCTTPRFQPIDTPRVR